MKKNGQLAVFFCAILWSTSGLFIKLIDWHPVVIAGMRSGIAVLFLVAVRSIFPRRSLPSKISHIFAAGLSYAITMLTFVIANKLTASANAILLQYTAPVWAALFGLFLLKEKPFLEQIIAMILVMAGLLLFFRDGLRSGSIVGDGIAVFSGICFGAHSVFMRMQKDGNPADSMLLAHIMCAVISIPFLCMFPPEFALSNVSGILFMGIIQIGCASLLFAYGIKRVSAVHAMLIAMIEPILNPVWVLLITGEIPSFSALIGGGIIILVIGISELIGVTRHRSSTA
ncbi:membrane protein [Spirochaetia bacterium]|nr:membrane protein [Spirochaetia bacterium]